MSERRRLCITKRACIAVMLLLVAGAIVNVAVAWGCVFWGDYPPRYPSREKFDCEWPSPVPENWPLQARHTYTSYWGTGVTDIWAYGKPPAGVTDPDTSTYQWRFEFGLPCRSMNWSRNEVAALGVDGDVLDDPAESWRDGWRPSGVGRDSVWNLKLLPLVPIWPGFAINTVFYAVILWGLFAAPFALRRRRRIKRGLCPKCAYPVGTWGGEVCTECGAAVRNSST